METTSITNNHSVPRPVTADAVRANPRVQALIRVADDQLGEQGYTEHGPRHANLVSHISENILARLGYTPDARELAAIAGYLHDIGNVVNRRDHASAGGAIVLNLLLDMGMDAAEAGIIAGAVGNHEERVGEPVSPVAAAVIIADKSDVHRTRVRNPNPITFDIHDRVNFASQHSFARVDSEKRVITLELTIDTERASVVDYFEIFLSRMLFIRKAANFLKCDFQLIINKNRML
ncbi:MAG TPA: HD domain-containing protein [Chloroflexota bacterium]|nr:HD domain-containing protein [Chloroflexota bacterium]